MKIITNGIKQRSIIYKLYDIINEKVYIGKTTIPIYMRINSHRHGKLNADVYFSEIGWDNVIFEIIDYSDDKAILAQKEEEQIVKYHLIDRDKLLNKNCSLLTDYYIIPQEFKILSKHYFAA